MLAYRDQTTTKATSRVSCQDRRLDDAQRPRYLFTVDSFRHVVFRVQDLQERGFGFHLFPADCLSHGLQLAG